MAWIELHQALKNHPKLLHLKALLGVAEKDLVRAKLENLWLWCFDYCPNGRLSIGSRPLSEEEIADASDIGEMLSVCQNGTLDERSKNHAENAKKRSANEAAALWLRSLIDSGWVDEIPGGLSGKTLQLHDWHRYGGKLHAQRQADADYQRDKRSAGRRTDVGLDVVYRGERGDPRGEREKEERLSGRQPPPSSLASPGDPGTDSHAPAGDKSPDELETVNRFAAWGHPSTDKKLEGIRELLALGLSHEYIRNGAQVIKPADIGFWDIMKAFKVAHRRDRNGRAKTHTEMIRGHAVSLEKPPVLQENRAEVQKRQDAACAKCDKLIAKMEPKQLDARRKDAENAATKARIPAGPMRDLFIKGHIRMSVADEHGIEGV